MTTRGQTRGSSPRTSAKIYARVARRGLLAVLKRIRGVLLFVTGLMLLGAVIFAAMHYGILPPIPEATPSEGAYESMFQLYVLVSALDFLLVGITQGAIMVVGYGMDERHPSEMTEPEEYHRDAASEAWSTLMSRSAALVGLFLVAAVLLALVSYAAPPFGEPAPESRAVGIGSIGILVTWFLLQVAALIDALVDVTRHLIAAERAREVAR